MTWGCEWRHAPEACAEDFGGFEKSQLSLAVQRRVTLHLLAKALWRVPHVFGGGGADVKARIERLCLSPYVEKPFNSKVIKSFVPELRSQECFLCFGIPMLYICAWWTLWTFCVPVWICLFHVSVSWYVTSSYYTVINYAFTFHTTNVFGLILWQFGPV